MKSTTQTPYDISHPIAQAAAPMEQAAVQWATQEAEAYLARMKAEVDAQPDLNILAPYPKYMRRPDTAYRIAYSRRQQFEALTADHPSNDDRGWNEPRLSVWDSEAAASYMERVVHSARASYIGYVAKLLAKADPTGTGVQAASLAGSDDLWTQSMLTLTLADGSSQQWKTKMIFNTSVHGKLFTQWPTRQVKARK